MKSYYENFKTPFFKIEVAAANSATYIELPDPLRRLIKKIEVLETKQEDCGYTQQVLITMIEGSREPSASTDAAALLQLYPLGVNGGALTNKVGLLTDLKFVTGGTGLSAISSKQIDKAVEFLKSFSQESKSSEKIINNINISTAPPVFLFQEFNKIKLTWGYLEDPSSSRVLKTVIYAWQTDFPEAGQPETVITCLGADAVLHQMAYSKAIALKDTKIKNAALDPKTGVKSEEFKGLKTKEALEYLCDQFKIKHYISDKIEVNTDVPRVLAAGKTLDSFFQELAKETQCYYYPFIDPYTDEFSIIFVPIQEYDKQIAIKDINLFSYKQPGSIVKSLSIRADFSGFFGAYKAAYKSNGDSVTAVSDNGVNISVVFDKKVEAVPDPASSSNSISVAKEGKTKQGTATHKAEINPNAVNSDYANKTSIRDAFCQKNRMIFMEMSCLGYPRIIPHMVVKISNIGYRYSGEYKIESVTHTIDEAGYSCRITAKTNQAVDVGYKNPNATKGEELKEEPYKSQLVKPKTTASLTGKPDPNSIDTFINLVLG